MSGRILSTIRRSRRYLFAFFKGRNMIDMLKFQQHKSEDKFVQICFQISDLERNGFAVVATKVEVRLLHHLQM